MKANPITISAFMWTLLTLYNRIDGTIKIKKEDKDGLERAQQAFWQASEFFDRVNNPIANPSYEFKKDSFRYLATRNIAKLAGFFGALGGFFGVILSFLSSGDSEELGYMKTEFAQINRKIDRLANSIDDVKTLIELHSQKAAYIDAEHSINQGFSQLKDCISRLSNVSCSNENECRRKKLLIANNYKSSLNVRSDVKKIVRGTVSDGVFGSSLLALVSDNSKCSIPEINKFANGVTGLLIKGCSTIIFYETLTHHEFDFNASASLIRTDLNYIEKKRQGVEDTCLKHINHWIRVDVKNSHGKFVENYETTNRNLLQTLQRKYPWIVWYVCTIVNAETPHIWSKENIYKELSSTAKDLKMHSVVMPVKLGRVSVMKDKKDSFMSTLRDFAWERNTNVADFSKKLLERFENNPNLKGEIQTLVAMPYTLSSSLILSHFQNGSLRSVYLDSVNGTRSNNILLHRVYNQYVVIASLEIEETAKYHCFGKCNSNGKCFKYPFSDITGCRCEKNYIGLTCNTSISDIQLLASIDTLVVSTLKLPNMVTIDQSLKNIQMYLHSSVQDIQQALYKLEKTMSEKIKFIGSSIRKQFQWFGTLLKYGSAISNLQYFTKIFKDDLTEEIRSSLTRDEEYRRATERTELSRFIIKPNGIRKWLYDIHYLLIGRENDSLHPHKSLLFMLMDRNKDQICSPTYKAELDKSYREILLLQLQGYILWVQALSTLHLDTARAVLRYNTRTKLQKNTMDETTCSVAIPNSLNFLDCTGGYYLHKDLRPTINCQNNHFLRGKCEIRDLVLFMFVNG